MGPKREEVAAARTGFSQDFLMDKGAEISEGDLGLRSCFYPFEVRASLSR